MDTVCISSRNMFPTEEQCAQYMAQIADTGDTILQTWRLHKDPYQHVSRLLAQCEQSAEWCLDRATILDIGCGTGEFIWHVRNLTAGRAAVEGINYYQCQASIGGDAVPIVVGDITKMELPPCRYDIVFCNYTMGYFDPVQVQGIMRKIYTALKPGGKLFMWDVMPASLACRSLFGYRLYDACEYRSMCTPFMAPNGAKAFTNWICPSDIYCMADNIQKVASEQQLELFRKFSRPVLYRFTKED